MGHQHIEQSRTPFGSQAGTTTHAERGERLEAEADDAARRIMQRVDPGASEASVLQAVSQRASLGQQFHSTPSHHFSPTPPHAHATGQPAVAPATSADLSPLSAGQALPGPLAREMGEALGADLSGVRVHAGEEGHAVSAEHDALAVASGKNLFFGRGMYKPEDTAGRALLAHEVAHTLHQGAVPTSGAAAGLSVGGARLGGPQRSGAGRRAFPGLMKGSGEWPLHPLPMYALKHKFAGYDISGNFNAGKPGGTSSVDIDFLRKTQDSKGFGHLLQELEKSGHELGSQDMRVNVDQAKKEVVEKFLKHGKDQGWNVDTDYSSDTANVTGPNMTLSKLLKKKKDDEGSM